MDFIADFHLHSKYSRAVSQEMVLPKMAQAARQKGIDILTTSDWTHGLWFREIRNQLEEKSEGLFKLKTQMSNVKSTTQNSNLEREPLFILSTEIASIYTQGGKLRRIHNLIFAPNFEVAEKINKELTSRGCNLLSDGRPIVGLSSKALLELILSIDQRCMLIPCHVWTPHFGVYGSASGFESLEEAFGELSKYIYGIETGLSSDPEMNWQIKELEGRSILSFSDAHSLPKMGREATVFAISNQSLEPSYDLIREAIMAPSSNNKSLSSRILYTLEFYPEEGKYHFSGHRNCKVVYGPKEIKEKGNTCPVCKRRLTEGVLFRLQQLASQDLENVSEEKISPNGIRWIVDKTKIHPPYVKLVPLIEIIAESLESTVFSQKVKALYENLCNEFGCEITVLLKTPIADIKNFGQVKIAEGIEKIRKGNIGVDPGYDGEYGKVKIWEEEVQSSKLEVKSEEEKKEQLGLF